MRPSAPLALLSVGVCLSFCLLILARITSISPSSSSSSPLFYGNLEAGVGIQRSSGRTYVHPVTPSLLPSRFLRRVARRPISPLRSVVEREVEEQLVKQKESSGEEQEEEFSVGDEFSGGDKEFKHPDGKVVDLEDVLGDFDMGREHTWLNQAPTRPPKWDKVDEKMFQDMPKHPTEDATYVDMFGIEPDPDTEQAEMFALMDKMEAEGTKRAWTMQEEPDLPAVKEEDLPPIDAEGQLDIILGTEPDFDEEVDSLMKQMEERGGIEFSSEYGQEPTPIQDGEPLELLNILFTDPDVDEERDEMVSAMDKKNPMTETPDFTPIPVTPFVENEQVILLRPDQYDSNGFITDPELLANDPDLVARQTKSSQMEEKINKKRDVPDVLKEPTDGDFEEFVEPEKEEDPQALALAEARAKAAEEARQKAEEERMKAEKELQELKAKIAAEKKAEKEAEMQLENQLMEESPLFAQPKIKKSKKKDVEKKKEEEVVTATGYTPPVVAGMPTLDDVVLNSELGEDYTPLREMLRTGEFRQADDWTRAKLIDIAGEGARGRGWVYFAEVPKIPYADLKSIDDLWRAGSGGKFGYSRQREIYARQGQDLMKMYEQMDWVTKGQDKPCPGCDTLCPTCVTFNYRSWKNDEFIYSIDAKDGHLPLTSTLRGNKLLLNLLNHPAIVDGTQTRR